jgi:hypothetical protein
MYKTVLDLSLFERRTAEKLPMQHESKTKIPLMAGQTMKFKTSITPCYSETSGNLLSHERSNKAVCPFLHLSHDLTTHASITDNNKGIIVR